MLTAHTSRSSPTSNLRTAPSQDQTVAVPDSGSEGPPTTSAPPVAGDHDRQPPGGGREVCVVPTVSRSHRKIFISMAPHPQHHSPHAEQQAHARLEGEEAA